MSTRRPVAGKHAQLVQWLFVEDKSFAEVVKLCPEGIGMKMGLKALANFFRKEALRRNREEISRSTEAGNAMVSALAENPEKTFQALIRVGGKLAFAAAMKPERTALDLTTIREFFKLLIAARRDDLENRKFNLNREKWEFDVSRRCADHQQALQEIFADESLDEDERLLTIRQQLFGDVLPE